MKKKRTDYITLAEMRLLCKDCYEEMKAMGLKRIEAGIFLDIEKEIKAATDEELEAIDKVEIEEDEESIEENIVTSEKEGIDPKEAYNVGVELGAFPAKVPLDEEGNPISGPKPVTRYYKKCIDKYKNTKGKGYCARVAWSIYCGYKNPGYAGCSEYGKRWGQPYT